MRRSRTWQVCRWLGLVRDSDDPAARAGSRRWWAGIIALAGWILVVSLWLVPHLH